MSAQRRVGSHKFVSAVILAAGASNRMRGLKQLAKLGRLALLERVMNAVRQSMVDEIVVVLGSKEATVRRSMDFSGTKVVVNPRFKDGMSGSLKLGVAAVSRRSKGALIVLADQPFLSAAVIDSLIDVFQRSDYLAVAPTYRGVQGNPVLLGRQLFSDVQLISGDVGAKSILRRHRGRIAEYPVSDAATLMDIDTEEDLKRARRLLGTARQTQSRKRPSA